MHALASPRTLVAPLVAAALTLAACSDVPPPAAPLVAAVSANAPPFVFPAGCCFYDGRTVRTVVPPAATPRDGRDAFYAFPAGAAAGQKGVVGVVPGDAGYHGGHWAFYAVVFVVAPYLLTSEHAILQAAALGDVTLTRVPGNDFRCPIQP